MLTLLPSLILLLSTLSLSTPANAGAAIAKAYYPGWGSDDFPLSKVTWSKYTHLTYAFAKTTKDGGLTLEGSNPGGLKPFVKAAHENGVKACFSIGGWTGSQYFSTAVSTPEKRTAFVKTIVDFAKKYDADCIDLNWEYPAKQGIGCNTIDKDDTPHFLSFLEELHAATELPISAAVGIVPFNDAAGNPITDVSGFAKVFEHIVIMNYDVWGPWGSTVGPNAPLNDTCAAPANQQGSAVSAVNAWIKAGMPAEKIVLGVPAYGHGFTVKKEDAFQKGSTTKLAKYPPFDNKNRPNGDKWDDKAGKDVCGNDNPAGGIFTFWGMVDNGYLKEDGTPKVPHRFDDCSKTPYVYNPDKQIMISYDDAKSMDHKGHFIKNFGLAGFSLWNAAGDYHDILVDAVRHGAGFKN
ncbi:glycoside hydrolase family 18 protein [Moniliophthora roreri MCA 2997]|uniref:chitinase-like effector n=2 Tax=Moniliophthora roreri TaxID=221103 RepID=CHI_MONRR|nr:chitinase-like effector [Moniliophthora roreri]ESK94160.1 glycoside hydrolase family 18 protein [Moniliophthora roreri MCA 2997]KAI3619290.1 glycoside hydrolase family 18 protein [Moniliophthora roreri]